MRIAQVAPLAESVPPKGYGGTERVVSYLTEELVQRGHDVTLFASGDSTTSATLVAPCPQALRTVRDCVLPEIYYVLMLDQVMNHASSFDVIHFHIDALHFPLVRRSGVPYVTTLHGRLDLVDLVPLYRRFTEVPVVSISDAQRKPLPWLNWQQTIYHGMSKDMFTFHEQHNGYLAFVGRINPEKRVDRAIEIARRVGMPLKIGAKVDKTDQAYFDAEIQPLLQQPHVEFLGEVGGDQKEALLGGAYAVLFPIDWPEPFGLVMIESFACGTPVIAFRCGSVPEVMRHGVSGFVVDTMEEAVEAVEQVAGLSRRRCRIYFEERFSVSRMAQDYLDVYRRLAEEAHNANRKPTPGDNDMLVPPRERQPIHNRIDPQS
ncbi:MAG: glycosyltransferase family 4 protein [Pseudohongiellaceae bacterium]